jgi:hypothetical protein
MPLKQIGDFSGALSSLVRATKLVASWRPHARGDEGGEAKGVLRREEDK